MISFGVKTDVVKAASAIGKLGNDQVPFATSLAINRTMQFARENLRSTMLREFDRPNPYTLGSLYTKNSTKRDLSGIVGHRPGASGKLPSSTYLRPEIEGGRRSMKSFEKRFGHYLIPSQAVRLDRYGNAPGALYRTIAASLDQPGRNTGKIYVIIPMSNPRGLPGGIYQRKNATARREGALVPVFFFSTTPQYESRYDLEGSVDRVFKAEFARQFSAAMDFALSTAKVKL